MDKEEFEKITTTKPRKSRIMVVVGIALFITVCISAVSLEKKSDFKDNIIDTPSDNVGTIYSNIIKTMSQTSNKGEEFSIKDIAALTSNSIVEINTETAVWGRRMGQYISEGAGSGIIISNDGYIVTNNHVIDGASKVIVKLNNGEKYEGKVIGKSSDDDIAVVKIEENNLQPVVFGDSDKLVVGDTAVVVGNPLGSLGGTVTNGIISALDREIDFGDAIMNLLQTNAAVNPGNSGGGLFNGRGELVGIVVAKSAGTDIEGIGFAIPINDAKEVIAELKEYGYKKSKVQLGVSLLDISDSLYAMRYRVESTGVYVQSVIDDSDAKNAGIESGDKIISVDGKAVEKSAEVKKIVSNKKVGDIVVVIIERGGKKMKFEVKLTECN